MKYTLFIDDERIPALSEAGSVIVIARSSAAAISIVKELGMPQKICFDHDLGGDDTSINFLRWVVNESLDGNVKIPENFTFSVHSQNPIGAENIRANLAGFLKFHLGMENTFMKG